jgi:hypothetical protein
MRDVFSLDDGLGYANLPTADDKDAERVHHRNDAEIRRRQQSGQDHGGDDLDPKGKPLRDHGRTCAADGDASKGGIANGWKECTVRREWSQEGV